MANKNWPVGTVVVATCVIIDYSQPCRKDGTPMGSKIPRIVARPGELGIVIEHCGSEETHEVEFSGGLFTSAPSDPAVRLYRAGVSTVCDGQECHPDQKKWYEHEQFTE